MKPELSREVVIGAKQPSMVRMKRLGRRMLGILPDRVVDIPDESSPEVAQLPVNNKDQAADLVHDIRDRIAPAALAEGVYIEPEVGSYAVRGQVASHDTADSEVTTAELEVLSAGGRETKFRVHVDEVKPEYNYNGLIPADASVMVKGTDGENLFGDGDFHPAERPEGRETIYEIFRDIAEAPDLHVHREDPDQQLH